jgi:hypothetical protein
MSDPTVVDEIASLRARGYTGDFGVATNERLRCSACLRDRRATDAAIESTARFEGASNPDDQAIVFGLRCQSCGSRGVLVTAYGPTATEDEAAVVVSLQPRT